MSGDRCTGCRVLVVEDELLIAVTLEDVLQALGCEIVGPVAIGGKGAKACARGDVRRSHPRRHYPRRQGLSGRRVTPCARYPLRASRADMEIGRFQKHYATNRV